MANDSGETCVQTVFRGTEVMSYSSRITVYRKKLIELPQEKVELVLGWAGTPSL